MDDLAARELVPGDVILVRLGDIVPADARLLDGDPVEVDQSALTGESLPVTRKPGEAVFSGSIIRQGEIDALVYATGAGTYFGKTTQLVESATVVSHFQRAVLKIGNYLIVLAVVLVALILGVALFRGDPLLTTLQFALVLTVAAIPVAMPTVLSVTMAVGARKLAAKEAIVSRLAAIEELAGIDVLCSDKTGTLTQNTLTLGEPFALGVTADEVIAAAALASRAQDEDVIDLAVLGGLKNRQVLDGNQMVHFQPFDPVHKRTESTIKASDGSTFKVTKGAPQVILALSANAEAVQPAVQRAIGEFAARGFRSLGVARTDAQGAWQFLGVLPLFDPPREDSRSTIAMARQMGVNVKMVTGDQLAIAREIAHQLGLGTNILDASMLMDAPPDGSDELIKAIEKADGFAQVFPEHKFHIVDLLERHEHIVGMTGDGVNDAPALKKADCGIAVSGATDAARAAADIVLLTPGLSVIIDAIKESRKIFQRMNSYAIYRIAETIRVLLVHDAVDPGVQLLPGYGRDDRDAGAAQRRRDSVDRLRPGSLPERAGSLGHAPRAGSRHDAGRDRRGGHVRALLPGRARIRARSPVHSDPDVPEAVGGRAHDDLRHADARAVLVDSPRADPAGGRVEHAGDRHADRGLWLPDDADWLGLGPGDLGLRAGLVRGQRPRQIDRAPTARAPPGSDLDRHDRRSPQRDRAPGVRSLRTPRAAGRTRARRLARGRTRDPPAQAAKVKEEHRRVIASPRAPRSDGTTTAKQFGASRMPPLAPVVFLLDVDNTLLDNDHVIEDLRRHLTRAFGAQRQERYWAIFEELRSELGYADYLGALQRYRLESPTDPQFLQVSFFLLDYAFANRLFPASLDVIERLAGWGPTVILTDGDVVFQPRKVQRSGLYEAVEGRVLIYIHKEQQLADVEARFPAEHYVLVDDKLRILTAAKQHWRSRLTTVFPRQGHYANDPQVLARYPNADISVARIGELVRYDLAALVNAGQSAASG